jgi:hypothetical protein
MSTTKKYYLKFGTPRLLTTDYVGATNVVEMTPKKDHPTSVRLTEQMVEDLKKIDKEERGVNWLIRYAVQKFLLDYKKEGLRDDVKAKLA